MSCVLYVVASYAKHCHVLAANRYDKLTRKLTWLFIVLFNLF